MSKETLKMQVVVDSPSVTERKLSITVPASDVNTIIDSTVRTFGHDLSLDGFRKGKVPAKVIEGRFASDIGQRSTGTVVELKSTAALDTHGLKPITDLDFKMGESEHVVRDQDFLFSFSFEVLAPIELPEDFEKISIEVKEPMLTPGEMNDIMTRIQKNLATLEEIKEDRMPEDGDVLLVDVGATYEGVVVTGMSAEKMHLQISPDSGAPEIDALLRTMKIGAESKGTLTVPTTYPDPKYSGKLIDIVVRLHTINKEILPEITEELAKQVGVESLDKLRKQLFSQSMSNKIVANKADAQNKLMEKLMEDLDFPVPQSLIERSYDSYMGEAEEFLYEKGMDQDSMRESLEAMRDDARADASKRAKSQAFLMALGNREGIVVGDKDVMKFVSQMAKQNNQDFNKLYEYIWSSGMVIDLKNQILATNALELMYAKVKKTIIDMNGKVVEIPEQYKTSGETDEKPKEAIIEKTATVETATEPATTEKPAKKPAKKATEKAAEKPVTKK